MEKILKFQKLDRELLQLQKQIVSSQQRAVMIKMIQFVKEAQEKSFQLEKQAKKMSDEYSALKKEYDKNIDQINVLTKTDLNKISKEEADELFNKINFISSNLYMIERNLNINIVNIKNLLKDFEVTKNQVLKARQKHKESKAEYDELEKNINPKVIEIKKEMQELEKEVDEKLLAKYKAVKNDKVFPVFVPVDNNNCGGCRMALPMGVLNKIKNSKHIICDQCGRVIYSS